MFFWLNVLKFDCKAVSGSDNVDSCAYNEKHKSIINKIKNNIFFLFIKNPLMQETEKS